MLQSSTGSIHTFEVATKSEIFVLPFHYFSNRVNQYVCPHVQQVCPNVRPTQGWTRPTNQWLVGQKVGSQTGCWPIENIGMVG